MKYSFLIVFLMTFFSCQPETKLEFYISPDGDDAHSGAIETPFASLKKAKQLIAELTENSSVEEVRFWLRDGEYTLNEPLVFDTTISLSPGLKVFFSAYPGENPVISGGKTLTNWRRKDNGLWESQLPTSEEENIQAPRELFVNGERAIRARHPNLDYLRVKEVGTDRRTNFTFEDGEIPLTENAEGIELVLLHDWSISRINLKAIDYQEHRITAIDTIGAKDPGFFNLDHWEPHPRYYLENAIEFLDQDYEWFFNPQNNRILLDLPSHLAPQDFKITVPYSVGLISIAGTEEKIIHNLNFQGLTFTHSAWQIPKAGYAGVQACHYDSENDPVGWSVVPAAVQVQWAKGVVFNNCKFENLGGGGVWIGSGCRNSVISNSRFRDISGNGIMVGEGRDRLVNNEPWWKVAPDQVATGNLVQNNQIESCGAQFFGAVGIWAGLTANTTIRANEIHHLPYTGVSVGWMWNPQPTPGRENIIEGNHIHHIMQTLSDGGGIYMLGLQPGSRISNNKIHHVELNVGRAESNGLFLDEGTTDVLIENNLVYEISKSPLRFHRATVNQVMHNYFFCREDTPPIRYNNTSEADIKQEGNLVYHQNSDQYLDRLQLARQQAKFLRSKTRPD